MKKIAIIGAGIMGSGMAANFLAKGYPVYLWNRNTAKLDDLVKKGGIIAATPKEAAQQADIIFEVTADDESSRSVWRGENGILAGANKNTVLIASATLSASWIDELARECSEKGLTFFDIPLTGGRAGAESGTLTLLAGGDKQKLEQLRSDLSAISEKVMYFGAAGSGTRFKLLLNMVQGIHLVVFAEAFKIAKAGDMNLQAVGEALAERMGGTTAMAWRGLDKHVENFAVKLIEKDLRYAKLLAGDIPTPLLDEALQKYGQEIKAGHGNEDWTIVTKD